MVFAPTLAIACFQALSWLLWATSGLMGVLFLRQWLIDKIVPLPVHLLYGAVIFVALGFGARLMARAVRRMLEKQG
jgi:hypothetical protein